MALYIVDGSCTGGVLQRALKLARADILDWKDSLEWGPVPARLSLGDLSEIRSHYWRGKPGEFTRRDAALARFRQHKEVVLCFGSTTLCQLALAQLLDWFSRQDLGGTKLTLVTAYGGMLRPEQFRVVLNEGQPIGPAQFRLGRQVWEAYRAPSPLRLQALLGRDLRALPEIRRAILFMLQEYPEAHDGLSRLQRKLVLSAASLGSIRALFVVLTALATETVGDLSLYRMLEELVNAKDPLLSREPGPRDFRAAILRVTPLGQKVLAGKADHVTLNGVDRWIGGVHLEGQRVWRWDERSQRIVT